MLRDRLLEIGVARGDDAHVRPDRFRATERVVLSRLEEVEELRLRGERELADLVEKKRASLGGRHLPLDAPRRRRVRPGEGAEQLALEQGLRQRGAVEHDEGMGRARPIRMDDARQLALPRP